MRQRHYRNRATGGELVFATTTVLDFVPVFKTHVLSAACLNILADVHHRSGAKLFAFVIMPEHIHFLTRLPSGESASRFVGKFKSLVAREIVPLLPLELHAKFAHQIGLGRRTFWQRSFRSFVVESESVYRQKVEYIHLNPVRRGLCLQPQEYPWSSARMFVEGLYKGDEEGLSLRSMDVLPRLPPGSPPPQAAEA